MYIHKVYMYDNKGRRINSTTITTDFMLTDEHVRSMITQYYDTVTVDVYDKNNKLITDFSFNKKVDDRCTKFAKSVWKSMSNKEKARIKDGDNWTEFVDGIVLLLGMTKTNEVTARILTALFGEELTNV